LIDKNGISWAINSAIKRNFTKISISAGDCTVLLDGALKAPPQFKSQRTIIRGDATEPIISFASIVAKVTRDRLMTRMAITYPSYKFEINKGYGTKDHIKAIEINGPCPIHRLSFLSRIVPKEGVLTY
jgi:ribonuclease HII